MFGAFRRPVVVTTALALISSACSYHNARLNFRELEQSGVFVATAPVLSTEARLFGKIEVNQRGFYFASCSQLASAAVSRLRSEAIARGGNVVREVRFRDRRIWSTSPRCRRNFTYVLLIVPMFLPFPQSVRVQGEAVFDPALASGRC